MLPIFNISLIGRVDVRRRARSERALTDSVWIVKKELGVSGEAEYTGEGLEQRPVVSYSVEVVQKKT